MKQELSHNSNHIQLLCQRLGLGAQQHAPSRVAGGFHHKMWRLETTGGTYAIKQLSADTDLSSLELTAHYNATEAAAQAFSRQGVSTIYALRNNAEYLHVLDNIGYLVYPWTNAVALDIGSITARHALEVARVLAKMHRANIDIPSLNVVIPDVHPEDKAIFLVQKAVGQGTRHASILRDQLPDFLGILAKHQNAVEHLNKHVVVCHGDLDHKNILWGAGNTPILIDWESARKLNPSYEVLLEALDWSGITGNFNHALFEKFISSYTQAGGVIKVDSLQASFDCILGDWLNWLMYNVGRTLGIDDAEQRAIGSAQVKLSLSTISRIGHLVPWLLGR